MKCSAPLLVLAAIMGYRPVQAQDLKIAHLGECALESPQVIKDCQLAYRTFGELNATKSNVIVFPSWASGKSEQIVPLIGPGKLIDSSKYFVVAIDAFANGVSSSPSNSKAQPRMAFPQITIHDMVEAEHKLLTTQLHIDHVFAVMGISMGGMQTFEWMVTYPDFMDRAIPIEGSPKLPGYDLILWQAEVDTIKDDPGWKNGDYTSNPAVLAEARLGALTLTSPTNVNAQFPDGKIPKSRLDIGRETDANDRIRQTEAMIALDVSKQAGGSLETASKLVKAKVLVIVSKQDHTVTPGPAMDFAKMLNAQVVELDSPCGHLAATCELPAVAKAVSDFLQH